MPMSSLFDLSGRAAVVTGGSQGLGFAMAKALADAGAAIVIADLDQRKSEAAAVRLGPDGSKYVGVRMDVTDPGSVRDVVKLVERAFGRLDIWINNAGIFIEQYALETSLEDVRKVLDVDLVGVFTGSCEAARSMRKTDRKSVV